MPRVPGATAHDVQSDMASQRAAVSAKLQAGYHYQAGGAVRTIDVRVGGLPTFNLGPGDVAYVKLVPASEPRYRFHGPGVRGTDDFVEPPQCDDCGPNTPAPNPQPLSCGSWTWVARGKGTLYVPGTGTYPNLAWVVDHGDGSCQLGFG